jgi:NLI interacting factor-like phosphatase
LVVEIFKAIQQADFIVPVEIEYHWHHFHVLKRPGVDNFLKKMGEIYEIVIFTASLSKVEMLLSVIVSCVNLVDSMPTRSLISLTSIKWWHIGYSGRAVIATRATMSR